MLKLSIAILAIFFSSFAALALNGPLFTKNQEIFRVVNDKGQTPTFRVLKDSLLKQSLAIAINSKWNLNEKSSDPKPYVDLKIEKIFLTLAKNKKDEIALSFQISGQQLEIDSTISREQLLAGKPILLKLPQKSEQLSLFKVTSEGQMTLRYKKSEDILMIENGFAKMQIESPLSDDESESIKLQAQGIRI